MKRHCICSVRLSEKYFYGCLCHHYSLYGPPTQSLNVSVMCAAKTCRKSFGQLASAWRLRCTNSLADHHQHCCKFSYISFFKKQSWDSLPRPSSALTLPPSGKAARQVKVGRLSKESHLVLFQIWEDFLFMLAPGDSNLAG